MKLDNHNLICAFVGFLLAALAGFAFSGGLAEAYLSGKPRCVETAVQTAPRD
jgi:hypothetical protein